MKLVKSTLIAFSMYSAIPMPRVDWDEEGMRYVLCCFPAVGIAVGAAVWGWNALCGALGYGGVLSAAGAALLPVWITGGIHLDGFCDTVDALASHREREEALRILSDSHVGAFAVMGTCGYFLLSYALWRTFLERAGGRELGALLVGFVLSRALSGLGVASMKLAKTSGLAHAFQSAAHRQGVALADGALALLSAAGMVVLSPGVGGGAALGAVAAYGYYQWMSRRRFGGVTGDLAGYFLTTCELAMALGAVLCLGIPGLR